MPLRLLLAARLLVPAIAVAWFATGWLDGPWGMLPGGRFRAAGEPCPDGGWERLAGLREVELELRPAHPRSVTIWNVVVGDELFVPADFLTPWKRWPHQVSEDPRVRLRAAGRVYECLALRVEDPRRIRELRAAAAHKYGLDPRGRAGRAEVWWFRIAPRT